MLKIIATFDEGDIAKIPFSSFKSVTLEPIPSTAPSGSVVLSRRLDQKDLVYTNAPYGSRIIDVKASLAKNGVTYDTISRGRWRVGSWQNSLKRAMRQQ